MIIADSDVLIDALRGRKGITERIALELQSGDLFTTAISAFELWSGAKTEREKEKVNALLGAIPIISLSEAAARLAAGIRIELEAKGEGIGMADYLIAGICQERRAILLTRNQKHFSRIPALYLGRLLEEEADG